MLDIREGKDSRAVKAIGVLAQAVFVGLLLLLLILFIPEQKLNISNVFNTYMARNCSILKRDLPERN